MSSEAGFFRAADDRSALEGETMPVEIKEAYGRTDAVKELFLEYAETELPGIDLCFQGFDRELEDIAGKYGPPDGRLYAAYFDGQPAGCVALRRLDGTDWELKRLFVRPAFRGKKIGSALLDRAVSEARKMGCGCILLD
ncbi:MAG: GNAT family N-acetyltransferase, partial [Synergistaceae bacterium]|nr:GNAT family N-acetyltransferase [Synergistaceae bacterium]